jgi:hypothetical protein
MGGRARTYDSIVAMAHLWLPTPQGIPVDAEGELKTDEMHDG